MNEPEEAVLMYVNTGSRESLGWLDSVSLDGLEWVAALAPGVGRSVANLKSFESTTRVAQTVFERGFIS